MNRSPLSEFLKDTSYHDGLPQRIISGWQSPSNIAFIKYWGKRPEQLPLYPSLSMTLERSFTQTRVVATRNDKRSPGLLINDNPVHPFLPKLSRFLTWIVTEIPVLQRFRFTVTTRNSFPHSTGIASSASGFSAFTLCLLSIASKATSLVIPNEHLLSLASYASRMGSGSACRSVYGGYTVWGKTKLLRGSSDQEAISVNDIIHPSLLSLRDAILVISRKPKTLSSSLGHETMKIHPFAAGRIFQAKDHFKNMLSGLKTGDMQQIGLLAEAEALSLHALLMSAPGGAVVLEPESLMVIRKIRASRALGIPLFFTLDAGPNVHLLYPETDRDAVGTFIETELLPLCEYSLWIDDSCGHGPREISGITDSDFSLV